MASDRRYGGRRRRSAREWAHLVGAWKRSGLTAKEFGASEGVSAHSLGWWRWRLRSRSGVAAVRFARVDVQADAAPAGKSMASPTWELVTKRGTLRVHDGIGEEPLHAVLRALLGEIDK
jgi:hypothetical protein